MTAEERAASVAVERAILAAVMLDPEAWAVVVEEGLGPDDWRGYWTGELYRAMRDLAGVGEEIEPTTIRRLVLDRVEPGLSGEADRYIGRLISGVPRDQPVRELCRRLRAMRPERDCSASGRLPEPLDLAAILRDPPRKEPRD